MDIRYKRLPLIAVGILFSLFTSTTRLSAQTTYGVLYETFTNSFDLCPQPNTFDAAFKSTLSSKGSEVIHLNHHVANIGDPMAQLAVGSSQTDWRLANVDGLSGTPAFQCAVNRTDFGNTWPRLSGSPSEWEGRIDQEFSKARSVDISYVSGSYDPTTRTFSATLDITSRSALTDTVKVRYAILQDNVTYAQCSGTGASKHNDVVRYITMADSVLALMGKPSGSTTRVTYAQVIRNSQSILSALKDVKLVVFIEETATGDDYHVTAAGLVLKGLDTLKPPARSLALIDSALDGHSFAPGTTIPIQFQKLNISAVSVYYSLDNGTTWRGIATSTLSPVNWTVPDSATTTGKIKVVDTFNGDPIAIEKGNFTIAASAKSIQILRPTSKDTLNIGDNLPIRWTKRGVGAVHVLLSRNGGVSWDTLAHGVTDTIYVWKVTGPATSQGVIKLLPAAGETVPQESDPFVILISVGVSMQPASPDAAIIKIYPNPSPSGDVVRISLGLLHPSAVEIEVYDVLGKLVASNSIPHAVSGSVETSVDTRTLAAGSYTVRVVTDKGIATSARVVIER